MYQVAGLLVFIVGVDFYYYVGCLWVSCPGKVIATELSLFGVCPEEISVENHEFGFLFFSSGVVAAVNDLPSLATAGATLI